MKHVGNQMLEKGVQGPIAAPGAYEGLGSLHSSVRLSVTRVLLKGAQTPYRCLGQSFQRCNMLHGKHMP